DAGRAFPGAGVTTGRHFLRTSTTAAPQKIFYSTDSGSFPVKSLCQCGYTPTPIPWHSSLGQLPYFRKTPTTVFHFRTIQPGTSARSGCDRQTGRNHTAATGTARRACHPAERPVGHGVLLHCKKIF